MRQAVVCVKWEKSKRPWPWRILLGLLLWAMLGGIGCQDHGSAVILGGEEPVAEIDDTGRETIQMETSENADVSSDGTAGWIYVHICGQVYQPGVYLLMEGSRVWDAVEAAGGLTEEAQPAAVNLAFCLADGSKITIPSVTEAEAGDFDWYVVGEGPSGENHLQMEMSAITESGRVDINRADVETLMTIPGIGQTRAEAIVAYRQAQGAFQRIEEIMNVTGIKEGLFSSIKEYISVGG